MKLRLTALALLLTAALTGCGLFGGAGNDISVHIQPTTLSFTYTYSFEEEADGSISESKSAEITTSTVTFRNSAGGAEAVVTGYEVRYVDEDGTAIQGGAFDFENEGVFSIEIPRGYVCADEVSECLGAGTPQIVSSEPESVNLLNHQLALFMVPTFPKVFAEIDFSINQNGVGSVYTQRVSVMPAGN